MKGADKMNMLIKLIEKYNGTLIRGDKSMKIFLKQHYTDYINDLRNAVDPNKIEGKDTKLVGSEMYDLVGNNLNKIKAEADQIIEILDLYESGKIIQASNKAFDLFDTLKEQFMIRYSGANPYITYYRIRQCNNKSELTSRSELFHIPLKLNYLAGPERYSVPGYPCLYLSSQWQLCWYECGKPKTFMCAEFDVPTEEKSNLKFIDFSGKPLIMCDNFKIWFLNTKKNEQEKIKVQKYMLKYFYTYPLRAACSVAVKHSEAKFIEEYIISQLLLLWVRNDEDFDGIRYESCKEDPEVKTMCGHNIVLVTKEFDEDGYDKKLRRTISVGDPLFVDIKTIKAINEHIEDPFSWNMSGINGKLKKI